MYLGIQKLTHFGWRLTSFKMCDLKSSLDSIHVFGGLKKSPIFEACEAP